MVENVTEVKVEKGDTCCRDNIDIHQNSYSFCYDNTDIIHQNSYTCCHDNRHTSEQLYLLPTHHDNTYVHYVLICVTVHMVNSHFVNYCTCLEYSQPLFS